MLPTLNPWIILGAIIIVLVLCAGSAYEGHEIGVNSQKVADQKQFDLINQTIARNKVKANGILRAAQERNANLAADNEIFNRKLMGEHNANREKTDALERIYAVYGLRFRAQIAGCGGSSGGSMPSQGDPASTDGTTFVQLPDAIARNLRQLAKDADKLRDDYRLCYDYANQMK